MSVVWSRPNESEFPRKLRVPSQLLAQPIGEPRALWRKTNLNIRSLLVPRVRVVGTCWKVLFS